MKEGHSEVVQHLLKQTDITKLDDVRILYVYVYVYCTRRCGLL